MFPWALICFIKEVISDDLSEFNHMWIGRGMSPANLWKKVRTDIASHHGCTSGTKHWINSLLKWTGAKMGEGAFNRHSTTYGNQNLRVTCLSAVTTTSIKFHESDLQPWYCIWRRRQFSCICGHISLKKHVSQSTMKLQFYFISAQI